MTNTLDRLTKNIQETEQVIQNVKENFAQLGLPDFVAEMEIGSLNKRLQKLKKQYEIASEYSNKEAMQLKFHPPGLPSGQIPVRTLTLVLGGLQQVVDSIANSLYNQPSAHGPIPSEILERNSLILKETKAGSFEVKLEVEHSQQVSMGDPMQTQTMNELFKLFNSSDIAESLVDVISDLGPRTLKHYKDWTKNLKELETEVEIEWRSVRGQSKVVFNHENSDRIYKILGDISDTVEAEETHYGRLTGVNVRTKTFEICLPSGERISGRILKDTVAVAANLLDKKCMAVLIKLHTCYRATGKEKTSWTLKEVQEHDYS
ncbi:hypothetical protein [Brevibacillus formosus]|uniref:hypothetical protein n=1 Tax=Brevibacillus formosus TaxID=54913 RepID=UPI003F19C1F4